MRLMSKIAVATLAFGLTAGASLAQELKFANFMPPTHPFVGSTFQPFADAVAAGTNGKVTVTLYNGGELGGGPVEQYSRVVDGVAELAVSLPGYTASNFPLTLIAELPGVIDQATGTENIWSHIDLFLSEYQRVALVSLFTSAENVLYTSKVAVHSPADLAGLKIRVPSRNAGLLVTAWGGTPVSMPVSEIYNAMQTGVIDGAMIDGTATKAFKLGEVASYITQGMKTTNSPFFILMNRDSFDALSPEDQAAVQAAGKQASLNGQASQLTGAAKGIEAFAATQGKQVIQLTAEEAAAFDVLSAAVVKTVVAETGGDAQAIVDALAAK